MKRFSIYVLLVSVLAGASLCWAEDIAVIVNRANTVDNLSVARLGRIYKGLQQQWLDGGRIVVVDRPPDSAVREVFYRKVLNSKPSQKFYLPNNLIPLRTIIQRSSRAAMMFVNNLPEAIGYLYLSELELDEKSKDIKILMIIKTGNGHTQAGEDMRLDGGEMTKGLER